MRYLPKRNKRYGIAGWAPLSFRLFAHRRPFLTYHGCSINTSNTNLHRSALCGVRKKGIGLLFFTTLQMPVTAVYASATLLSDNWVCTILNLYDYGEGG